MKPLNYILNISTIILLIVSNSCKSSLFCDSKVTNEGDIEMDYKTGCLPVTDNQNFVIRSNEELFELFVNEFSNCDSSGINNIDFNEFTLLGCLSTGGCKGRIERKVEINTESEQATYTVVHESCGKCKQELISYNWVLIKAIPDNYTVDFIVE